MNKPYESIAEFFYKRASKRIRERINKYNLKHIEICPDHKQISRIINNKRTKNNPYLINDAVLQSSYKNDETGKHVTCGLISKLKFKSAKEVLWGTKTEIACYMHELFILLWDEICVQDNLIDTDFYLCDYIPYAKYSTYWKILFESDRNDSRFSFEKYNDKMLNFPAIFFGIKEDDVIENIDSTRKEAFEFLYKRCKDSFYSVFTDFANKNESFHMLNKIIKTELVEKRFIPLIEKYKPDASSLGLRVKNLIYEDLSYSASLIFHRNIDNPKFRQELIDASSNYIHKLESIQKSIL